MATKFDVNNFMLSPNSIDKHFPEKLCPYSSLNVMNLQKIFQAGLTSSIVILYLYVKIISAQFFGGDTSSVQPALCNQWTTSDGLLAANCSVDNDVKSMQHLSTVPKDLPPSLQVIDLRPTVHSDNIYSGILMAPDMFKPYPNLRHILLQNVFQILLTTRLPLGTPEVKKYISKVLASAFTNLNSLEYLEITDCDLQDWTVVHLPPQLKSLNFDRNKYSNLDVHWAEELEELSVKNNFLNNIPRVSVPSPPLKKLWVNGNLMMNMTIVDVAQLCELSFLEMLPNAHFTSNAGFCQCVMLKKWANETQLQGLENLSCSDKGDKSTCSENTLEEARKIRKKCPLLFANNAALKAIKISLKYTFMFIMLALLAAALILYTIRHFHLREYWRDHHFRLSQATSIKMEEGEEDIVKSPGQSQDSSIQERNLSFTSPFF